MNKLMRRYDMRRSAMVYSYLNSLIIIPGCKRINIVKKIDMGAIIIEEKHNALNHILSELIW
jgi:hypothetical protein